MLNANESPLQDHLLWFFSGFVQYEKTVKGDLFGAAYPRKTDQNFKLLVEATSINHPFDSFEQAHWTPFLLRAVICYRQDTLIFSFVVKKVCEMKLVLSFHYGCTGNVLTLYDWSRWDTIKGDKGILQTLNGYKIS